MSHSIRRPQSPQDLIDYARRQLGEPVINLELAPEQCLDRVYEAIEKFIYEHYDGVTEGWYPYTITRQDLDNEYLSLPDDVASVLGVIDLNSIPNGSAEAFERVRYILANSDWIRQITFNSHGGSGLLDWHLNFMNIEMVREYFSPKISFQFNETTKRLYLNSKLPVAPPEPEVGEEDTFDPLPIILHCYRNIDPDQELRVYGDEWVRRYTTALIGRQWGSNIKKYDGVQLPGGVTLNGERIFEQYNQEVQSLNEEFDLKYKLPGEMFVL